MATIDRARKMKMSAAANQGSARASRRAALLAGSPFVALPTFALMAVDCGELCADVRALLLGFQHVDPWHDRDVPADEPFHRPPWLKLASSPPWERG
jgi:hypothetical protein